MINTNGILITSIEEEAKRIEEISQLDLQYTKNELEFERITKLAARIFQVPICLVSIVTEDKQWFKSCVGLPPSLEKSRSTDRKDAFCQYVVFYKEPVVVNDTLLDSRFRDNILVKNYSLRFYAGYPLKTENGNIIGTLCILDTVPRDFTEEQLNTLKELSYWVLSEIQLRKQLKFSRQVQQELYEKNEQNKWLIKAIENTQTGVTILESRNSTLEIKYYNQAFANLYRIDPNTVTNRSYYHFRSQYNQNEIVTEIKSAIESENQAHLEVENINGNDVFWTSLHISPVYSEQGGKPYIVIVETDITEDRILLESIKKEYLQQSNILNTIPDLFYVTDKNNKLVSWNKAFEQSISQNDMKLSGEPIHTFLHDHDISLYKSTIQKALTMGTSEVEINFKNQNDHVLPLHLSVTAVRNKEGKVLGIACVGKDMKERIQLRKDVTYASNIQQALLPRPFSNQRIELNTYYRPKNFISGDFFNFKWNNNKLCGYLVDLMGHGIATALQSSSMRILIQQAYDLNQSFAEKLKFINTSLLPFFPEGFYATGIVFEFDFNRNILTYASAGLNQFLYNEKLIEVPGAFLGVFPDIEYEEHKMNFSSQDQFLFFTDGLLDWVENNPDKALDLEKARDITTHDDISAIAIKVK